MELMLVARRIADGGRICEHCDARVIAVAATHAVPAHFELVSGERHGDACPWDAKERRQRWMASLPTPEERERSNAASLESWMAKHNRDIVGPDDGDG